MNLKITCELTKSDIEYLSNLWDTNDFEEIETILESIFSDDVFIKRDFFQTFDFNIKKIS